MTIEDNKKYKLTGEQIKDLASRFGVLSGEIGDLSTLTTTDKTSAVAAINELGLALDGKQDELTAGENITIEDESGALVISATDTTYSNFTGTDGTAAGAAGLVPAPATTDAGKYLKADGTWDTAGGGSGIIELTSADYNYPTTGTATSVALWLLDAGEYYAKKGVYVIGNNAQNVDSFASDKYITVWDGVRSSSGTDYDEKLWKVESFTESGGTFYLTAGSAFANGGGAIANPQHPFVTWNDFVIAQGTGTSTTSVMSQNAVTSMVFADPATQYKIKIGAGTSSSEGADGVEIGHNAGATAVGNIAIGSTATASGSYGAVAIGNSATASSNRSVALGPTAYADGAYSVALGKGARATVQGQFDVSTGVDTTSGYNSSNYRLLTGLYDPQSAHDAATKGYVDPTTDSSAPTTATVGRLGQIQIDTTNADAYMCVAVDSVTPSYTWKKITA